MNKIKAFFRNEKLWYPFHVFSHPADGYYEIRHREKGSVIIAFLLVFIYSLCFSLNRIYASFVVNDIDERTVNALTELVAVIMLYLLFCVGNWSITAVMGGEGRFKDILIVVGYALLPMILTTIPAIFISQAVAANEEAFYGIIIGLGTAYSLFIGLIGIMTIHNFSLGKTIITLFLTFIAMFIIIFIAIMLTDLISQVYGFFYSLYLEMIYRT
ncbi:MAG: YIP1 family protein [Lachnospiraceae bacterium]|nr:YIP1 family protein [Lachnospiraceae bacterium]